MSKPSSSGLTASRKTRRRAAAQVRRLPPAFRRAFLAAVDETVRCDVHLNKLFEHLLRMAYAARRR